MIQQQILQFPLIWHGRLVTIAGTEGIPEKVEAIYHGLLLENTEVSLARTSSAGSYQTWQLRATVPDNASLRALFTALEVLPGVKMLI